MLVDWVFIYSLASRLRVFRDVVLVALVGLAFLCSSRSWYGRVLIDWLKLLLSWFGSFDMLTSILENGNLVAGCKALWCSFSASFPSTVDVWDRSFSPVGREGALAELKAKLLAISLAYMVVSSFFGNDYSCYAANGDFGPIYICQDCHVRCQLHAAIVFK